MLTQVTKVEDASTHSEYSGSLTRAYGFTIMKLAHTLRTFCAIANPSQTRLFCFANCQRLSGQEVKVRVIVYCAIVMLCHKCMRTYTQSSVGSELVAVVSGDKSCFSTERRSLKLNENLAIEEILPATPLKLGLLHTRGYELRLRDSDLKGVVPIRVLGPCMIRRCHIFIPGSSDSSYMTMQIITIISAV